MDAADPILNPVYGMESNGLRILHASDTNSFTIANLNVHSNAYSNRHVYTHSECYVYANANTNTNSDSIRPGWTGSRRKFVGGGASRSSVRRVCR